MQIDRALILSAGLGTRMGEIGKILPKVLWPIFNKTLLELQIDYCRDLGIKEIYINTHFLHEEIVAHLKKKSLGLSINILNENPLLDSGGAIHNLAEQKNVNYQGNVLLVNADQFLFFSKDYYATAIEKMKTSRACLFGIKVDKDSSYNETVINGDQLVEIKKPDRIKEFITYSGLGLLNLDGLRRCHGISKFFETVTDYKNEHVAMIVPNSFEYWDFGTAKIYHENIFRIKNAKDNQIADFLNSHNVDRVATKNFLDERLSSIDLEMEGRFFEKSISYKSTVQKV